MHTKRNTLISLLTGLLIFSTGSFCASIVVPVERVDGDKIGEVTFVDLWGGVLIKPALRGLPPGVHGFHVHQHDSCANDAMAAGGHLDPKMTNQHRGPYNDAGHLGDLPVLVVNQDGTATLPLFAPRLKVEAIQSHALMIHAGGDNYSDTPEKLGGGGARIACGVIGS